MIDDAEKTERLIALIQAHLPFEVRLAPVLLRQLKAQSVAAASAPRHIVRGVSYAGDEGGIICQVDSGDGREGLFVSLTHLLVPATVPVAPEAATYQKHRIKKLKKLHGA